MKKLDTLYKKTSTGADQFWEISVDGSTIKTRWGQINGKIQETNDLVKEGKNTGRANATTAAEQALSEATSRWEHKLKKGYVKDLASARAGKTDKIITGGIFPMLAGKFSDQGDNLAYPCLVQPKFDGHRCIAIVDEHGKCTLWTRSRKPITSMGHIIKEIEQLGVNSVMLDGELYNHDYKDRFEKLTSFIRDSSAKPGSDVVQYHVYDVVTSQPQRLRTQWLHIAIVEGRFRKPATSCDHIVYVRTDVADNEEDLMESFRIFLAIGYEGAMARNTEGTYVNKRSNDLLKIKEFDDAEFKVVGVEEGRGKLAGHGIFVCTTEEGNEFRAKMMGDTADLKQYWENPKFAVGRYLTVKYQGYTKRNQVPRFPVALRFKED
jgi:ATP-dependent DNA ligase